MPSKTVTIWDLTALGLSYRTVDYWVRQGYLRANNPGQGTGRGIRTFPASELAVADTMRRLTAAGVTPLAAHRAARGDGWIAPDVRVVLSQPAGCAA